MVTLGARERAIKRYADRTSVWLFPNWCQLACGTPYSFLSAVICASYAREDWLGGEQETNAWPLAERSSAGIGAFPDVVRHEYPASCQSQIADSEHPWLSFFFRIAGKAMPGRLHDGGTSE